MIIRRTTRKECLKQLLVLLLIVALPWFCMHLVTEPKTMLQVNAVSQSQLAQEFLKKDYHDKIQVKLRKSI